MIHLRKYVILSVLSLFFIACTNDQGSTADDDAQTMETPYEIKGNDKIASKGLEGDKIKVYRHSDVDQKPVYGPACETSEDPWECTMNTVEIFIQDNINWPHEVIKERQDGYEEISFVVTSDGGIDQVEHIVSKDQPCPGCQEAALEVVSKLDDWKAGIKDGQPVAVQLTVPIRFNSVE